MTPFNYKLDHRLKTDADGVSVRRNFIAHYQVSATNAVATSNTAVLSATALTTAVQAITENITNPATPRNIKIVGNVAGIAGNVTIKGTNYNGDSLGEVIALNGTTAVEGNKAFKTVTEIDLPIQTAAGNTVSVGFGNKLGLPYKLQLNTILKTYVDSTLESTAPTVTVDNTALENNTFTTATALGGKVVDVYLIV